MPVVFSNAAFVAAVVAFAAALIELRTALRLRGADDVSGTVEADDGALRAPVSLATCVVFSLTLIRRRLDQRVGNALQFFEQRAFSVRVGDRVWRIDQKVSPVVFMGLDVVEKPLPFLPQDVLGLLVKRFGHLGHLWAEDHVVVVREAVVADGARVHLLVVGDRVLTVATKPLKLLAGTAFKRAARFAGFAVVIVVAAAMMR